MHKARFVLSKPKLREQYAFLSKLCPRISYSIKTNPEVGMVLDSETDCFFSVHTPEGLGWVSDLRRVWFLPQGLDQSFFKRLLIYGLENFVVDNEPDLRNLLRVLEEGRWKVNLMLRMRFEETTIYKGRFYLFGFTARKINELVQELRQNPNIRNLGVHFHRKTQNTGNWSLRESLESMLSEEALRSMDIMSIGGGIPIDYKNTSAGNMEYIVGKIGELREWLESWDIKMIMEPGRPLAGPPVRLETCITSVDGRSITVNASVYNTSLDTIIVPHKLLVDGEGEGDTYTIKGCTPCSMDIFRYEARLRDPRVGQRLVFLNAGAYNFHSTFCNLERPPTIAEEHGEEDKL